MIGGALYVALVYLHPGQQDALRRYENLALPVFRRHGGRFERILSPAPAPGGGADPDAPDEIGSRRRTAWTRSGATRRWWPWSRSARRSSGRRCWSGSTRCRWSANFTASG